MGKIKLSISNIDGTTQNIEVEGSRSQPFTGRKIGDEIEGTILDMPDIKFQITGGSDKDGFPMRPDVHGGIRKRILLSSGTGFNQKAKGERRRKMIRGNTITDDIVHINLKTLTNIKK